MKPTSRTFRRFGTLALLSFTLLSWMAPLSVFADEEDSVRVYKLLSPSVVSITSAEGSGTGILVNSKGTIITNAHVITSPLPIKVHVDVLGPGDKTQSLTYKNVKIVGYHPTFDLALIKVDPQENRGTGLKPVVLARQKASPGQSVFVIGNPAAGGQVLNKSITSGILSAVDRTIEGAAYYQIDAAINPGNSGGPICDRNGRVLGLVTFKFIDADAIGFAIPLYDIDPKSFVALSKRRSDPAKAQELLKMADKFSRMSRDAVRVEGPEGSARKVFDLDAAMCYREALLYDATNPDVYYNVGTILRTLDADDVATGYLAYSVQLAPWHDAEANPYRELGLALVKKNKESAALSAWGEGLAKFPYAAKIWEDLAINHIQRNHSVDAAVCASTALLIAEKDTRREVMQHVLRDAKEAAGPAIDKLIEESANHAIVAKLDRMLAASNKARSAKKLYLLRDFEAVIKEFGGPPVEGVETTIPTDPIRRLPELARITPAKDAKGELRTARSKTIADKSDDGWIGNDGESPKTHLSDTIKPIATHKTVVKTTRTVVDANVTDLDVSKVVDVCWSNDGEGKYLFVLQFNGLAEKIEVASWTVERQINLATPCSSMAMSKEGLFIGEPTIQDVALLDADSLELKARFPVPNLGAIAGVASLSQVYASADGGRLLNVLDGKTKKVSAQISSADVASVRGGPGNPGIGFVRFAVTPNGEKMLCESSEQLHRLSIDKSRLRYEDAGPRIGSNPQQVVVSADSKYVAMPSGGGNRDEAHQGYNIFIYKIDDLAKPVCILDSGPYPRTMAFDFTARRIYAQNIEKQLIIFTPKGIKQKEYTLFGRGEEPNRMLVHPSGHKVLVNCAAGLAWVELPK